MRFRLIVFSLFVTSCGLNTGEKAPDAPLMKVSESQYTCISKIAEKTIEYGEGRLNDSEISSFIGCLQNAFFMFVSKFHGKQSRDVFTATEIRDFLQDGFLPKDHKITDELLHQFMVIKDVIVGGGVEVVTKSELQYAIQILNVLKEELTRIRPVVKTLNATLIEEQELRDLGRNLKNADRALNKAVESLSAILTKSKRSYSVDDFAVFMDEFRKFIRWDEHVSASRPGSSWKEVLVAFKRINVSEDREKIAPEDWPKLLTLGYRWYLNYLRFKVGVRDQAILEGEGFDHLVTLVDDVEKLMRDAVKDHPGHFVPFEEIERMIAAIKRVDWLPKKVQSKSVIDAIHALVEKILGREEVPPENRPNVIRGVSKYTIDRLAVEFSKWEEIQRAIQEENLMPKDLIRGPEIRDPLIGLALTTSPRPLLREGWQQFVADFPDKRPLFKDDFVNIFLIEEPRLKEFSVVNGFGNRSKMNVFKTIADLIFKGYTLAGSADSASKSVSMSAGISQAAMQSAYFDFYDFLADIGFVDRRVRTAAEKRFIEAKLFVYDAEGYPESAIPVLSKKSFILETANLFSGGNLGFDLYKHMSNYCKKGINKDQYGFDKLERKCVLEHLISEFIEDQNPPPPEKPESKKLSQISRGLIDTMPALTKYLRHLDSAKKLEFAQSLLDSAWTECSEEDPDVVEYSEFATFATVLHYSEILMTSYNTFPFDDVLDEAEINKGLPIFNGFVKVLAKSKGIDLTEYDKIRSWARWIGVRIGEPADHIFKFILANGRIPDPKSKQDSDAIYDHVRYDRSWNLSLDRADIVRVFSTILKEMTKKSAICQTPYAAF